MAIPNDYRCKNVGYMLPLEMWEYVDENLFYRQDQP